MRGCGVSETAMELSKYMYGIERFNSSDDDIFFYIGSQNYDTL